jgi:hypothetical protein
MGIIYRHTSGWYNIQRAGAAGMRENYFQKIKNNN